MRQVVRDIEAIDPCVYAQSVAEVRVVLEIDQHGQLTNIGALEPTSPQFLRCVEDALEGWEFAPAPRKGELLVVYRPRDAHRPTRLGSLMDVVERNLDDAEIGVTVDVDRDRRGAVAPAEPAAEDIITFECVDLDRMFALR